MKNNNNQSNNSIINKISKYFVILTLLFITIVINSCSVITGIFKAGMGFGIFIIVVIVLIVIFAITRFGNNKNE